MLPEQWHKELQKVVFHPNANTINILLGKMKRELENIIDTRIIMQKDLNFRNIKDDFDTIFGRKKRMKTFFDFYEQFMKDKEYSVTEGTIRNYKSTLTRLKDYVRHSQTEIDFDSIDDTFYTRYTKYLHVVSGCYNNSTGKLIKTLKAFMHHAYDKGWTTNLEYQKFKVDKEEATKIFLTHEELDILDKLDLNDNPTLAKGHTVAEEYIGH